MSNRRGWLTRENFEELDRLIGLLGYGGYYDYLEALKEIGSKIGAYTVPGGEIDRMDIKTLPDIETILSAWAELISKWRRKNPDWAEEILKEKTKIGFVG